MLSQSVRWQICNQLGKARDIKKQDQKEEQLKTYTQQPIIRPAFKAQKINLRLRLRDYNLALASILNAANGQLEKNIGDFETHNRRCRRSVVVSGKPEVLLLFKA